MTTPSINSQMHNDIMVASSRERTPMLAPAEAIHMILNGISDDIYSTVDACYTAREMWLAIKRLQQGDSINKQDFLQQLQPEWSRFVTIVKQQQDLDTVSYHRLFDILKQHQNEVNEIHVEKIAKNANPLALVAVAQHYPDKKMKRAKDYAYHKENMMLCKQEEKRVPLRPSYDVEPLEKVHSDDDHNVFANDRQHFKQPESFNDTYVVETIDSIIIPDSLDMCDNEGQVGQNAEEPEDERVLLASLIAKFKLDLDGNKKSQRQLKKANTLITQELYKSKQDLEKTKHDLEKTKILK
ncbi:hypothetical protein Tco_1417576 [Tanacetum coccineum]